MNSSDSTVPFLFLSHSLNMDLTRAGSFCAREQAGAGRRHPLEGAGWATLWHLSAGAAEGLGQLLESQLACGKGFAGA